MLPFGTRLVLCSCTARWVAHLLAEFRRWLTPFWTPRWLFPALSSSVLQDQTTFYHEVAAAAVQAGVSIDLFAVAGEAPAEEPPVDPSVQPGQNPPQLSAQPSSGTEAEDASYFDLATLSALTRETGGSLFRCTAESPAHPVSIRLQWLRLLLILMRM